jgi:hypothetical protein
MYSLKKVKVDIHSLHLMSEVIDKQLEWKNTSTFDENGHKSSSFENIIQ